MLDRVVRVSAITLHTARSAGPQGASLMDVLAAARREFLPERAKGVPLHTGATVLGSALLKLLDAHLIQITVTVDGKAVQVEELQLQPIRAPGLRSEELLPPKLAAEFDAAYNFACRLRGHEHQTAIGLTAHFFKIQEALGLSLTEMISKKQSSLFVTPVFPKPQVTKQFDVFAIMPFAQEFGVVYEQAIKPACLSLFLRVGRGDNIFGATHVINDIWSAIYTSNCIIADCTSKNPNVFYELGIAHTLGKNVVLLTRKEGDIPFDLRHWRYITYELTQSGLSSLRATLQDVLQRVEGLAPSEQTLSHSTADAR
jgi:hypothetical protein